MNTSALDEARQFLALEIQVSDLLADSDLTTREGVEHALRLASLSASLSNRPDDARHLRALLREVSTDGGRYVRLRNYPNGTYLRVTGFKEGR